MVLLLLGGLVYLNRVGLPQFLKVRLLSELRARGVDLNFTRLRLRWYHGLVAENISLGRADDTVGPHLSVGQADIKLDPSALRHLRLQVNSLRLHEGRLVLPLISPGGPPEQFVVNGIMTELHLLPRTDGNWTISRRSASEGKSISPAPSPTRRRSATGSSHAERISHLVCGKLNFGKPSKSPDSCVSDVRRRLL